MAEALPAASLAIHLEAFASISVLGWTVTALVFLFLIAVACAFWRRPDLLVRVLVWLPAHTLYRIRVFGADKVPSTGPVLFVCNHVSYIDALLLFAAQRRRVRFMVWAPFMHVPGVRLVLRMAGAIPIDGGAGPRAIVQSLRLAGEAIGRGEAVCIFAEGGITRIGFMLPFHRGFEQILKRHPAPVVPVCLENVWGSIFSYRGGKPFWKWPQKLPYPVTVAFGPPMPPTANAVDVRQAIQKLSADCAIARTDERLPVHRQFVKMAARHPFRSCLVDTNTNPVAFLSYGKVLAGAIIISRLLKPRLGNDKMVGVWLPQSVGGAFANISLAILGKTSVNLNYTSSGAVVGSAIRQCGIRKILTSRLFTHKVHLEAPDCELIYLEDFRKEVTNFQRLRAFLTVVLLPSFVLDRWVLRLAHHKPDDLATIIFSSGSTGDPKGVMLTHGNLSANAESVIQLIDPGPQDRLLGVLPFFHSFGYTVTLWLPLQVGTSMVFHPDPRQAKEIGDLCRNYRCTILLETATFLRLLMRRCGPDDFLTVRILMCGAEKLPPSLSVEFQDKFRVLPLEGYGCTELSPVACANIPDWEEDGVRQIGNKQGTIGQPVPGVAARIVNPETFEPLPSGKEGLLMIYGANVMKGYLGQPEATNKVIRDGWYATGDIAKFDDDGFVMITDRLARFSKIGGEMVPHQKIEDELHKILSTNDRIFVVTAVPDPRRGERLVVLHTPLNGRNVRQICQELNTKGLPNLWVPGERDFFQVPEFPILGTGKVDLKQVRNVALQLSRPDAAEK